MASTAGTKRPTILLPENLVDAATQEPSTNALFETAHGDSPLERLSGRVCPFPYLNRATVADPRRILEELKIEISKRFGNLAPPNAIYRFSGLGFHRSTFHLPSAPLGHLRDESVMERVSQLPFLLIG